MKNFKEASIVPNPFFEMPKEEFEKTEEVEEIKEVEDGRGL